jgi:hypothetical protein
VKVPQLSPEARSTVQPKPPLPLIGDDANRKEWLLARLRSMSLGMRLVQAEIDEIGISLKNGWISSEQAYADILNLESIPVSVAAVFYSQGGVGE